MRKFLIIVMALFSCKDSINEDIESMEDIELSVACIRYDALDYPQSSYDDTDYGCLYQFEDDSQETSYEFLGCKTYKGLSMWKDSISCNNPDYFIGIGYKWGLGETTIFSGDGSELFTLNCDC